jgi:hypothetical protein
MAASLSVKYVDVPPKDDRCTVSASAIPWGTLSRVVQVEVVRQITPIEKPSRKPVRRALIRDLLNDLGGFIERDAAIIPSAEVR